MGFVFANPTNLINWLMAVFSISTILRPAAHFSRDGPRLERGGEFSPWAVERSITIGEISKCAN